MSFVRSRYPDIPGVEGAPCWTLKYGWVYFDADWHMKHNVPVGTCLCLRIGPIPEGTCPNWNPGFTLDLNAPMGEPNRLYLFFGHWHVIVGLPEFRDSRVTGREVQMSLFGRQVPVVHMEYFTNWLRPHIAGCSRYKYHRDTDGDWVRDDKPAPLHWGWLTIERRPG